MLEVGVFCGFSTIMAFAEEIVVNAKGEKNKFSVDERFVCHEP